MFQSQQMGWYLDKYGEKQWVEVFLKADWHSSLNPSPNIKNQWDYLIPIKTRIKIWYVLLSDQSTYFRGIVVEKVRIIPTPINQLTSVASKRAVFCRSWPWQGVTRCQANQGPASLTSTLHLATYCRRSYLSHSTSAIVTFGRGENFNFYGWDSRATLTVRINLFLRYKLETRLRSVRSRMRGGSLQLFSRFYHIAHTQTKQCRQREKGVAIA